MTTKKHTTTLISLAAGLCLFAGASAASATAGDATAFDPNDRPGVLATSSEMTAPGFFTPGFFIDPTQTPVGYIDIPEIDRGPEGDENTPGTSESNLPANFGEFEGPDWLFTPFEFESETPVVASSGSVLDLLYTEAPDLVLSLDNKPEIGISTIPAPGTGLLGVVGGLALVRRRR